MHSRLVLSLMLLMAAPLCAQQDPAWTAPIAPFQIADNLFYVGSKDLASFLVTTPRGDILINVGTEANAPMVRRSIEELGFTISDVKILLNGQAHSDHVGGDAEILHETHAEQMVMDGDVAAVEHGGAGDFASDHYPPSRVDRVLHDGETVQLGGVTLVAHKTAGHTRGCTTWTMRTTQHGVPRDVVIVGGVSSLDYRLVPAPGHPAQWPGILADFEHTYAVLRALHCDIFLGAHGSYFNMLEKLARRKSPNDESVWLDAAGYRAFVADSEKEFRAKVQAQTEQAASEAAPDAAAAARLLAAKAESLSPSAEYNYESGTMLDGLAALYNVTGEHALLDAISETVARWINAQGEIVVKGKPFDTAKHTLDDLEPGRAILFDWQHTHDPRLRSAADFLYAQFATQPRNSAGGFWHKQIYPDQMWLDGAYMAEPFRSEYARAFHDDAAFADIARQFGLMFDYNRDPATGLLNHGWDAAHRQQWANKTNGQSPESWARGMGWYAMALVDTMPNLPPAQRADLEVVLKYVAGAIARTQDASTGLWWDVLSQPGRTGNFFEASASAMFVYALAKGVRLGYLSPEYETVALLGWNGIASRFLQHGASGTLTLTETVKASGLGGNPYRAGDFDYYVHERRVDDDPKGLGAAMLAASEIMQLGHAGPPGGARDNPSTNP